MRLLLEKLMLEYQEKDLREPLKSFDLQKDLNPIVWEDEKLKPEIREELMSLADDIFASLELEDIEYEDVQFTGSLANYNWSKYADVDLHILVDYTLINPDVVLVEKYLDEFKKNWNKSHNILIYGFDLEIYVQNTKGHAVSTGVYSVLNDTWVKKPNQFKQEIDKEALESKSISYMEEVDDLEELIADKGVNLDGFNARLKKVWKKIKNGRQAGLETDGELSTENLVFKLLRRNGYIEKIIDLKAAAYDMQHTIK